MKNSIIRILCMEGYCIVIPPSSSSIQERTKQDKAYSIIYELSVLRSLVSPSNPLSLATSCLSFCLWCLLPQSSVTSNGWSRYYIIVEHRLCMALVSWIMSRAVAVTYIAFDHSFWCDAFLHTTFNRLMDHSRILVNTFSNKLCLVIK